MCLYHHGAIWFPGPEATKLSTNTALTLTVGSTHLTESVCTHHVSLSSWCYMVPSVIGHIAVYQYCSLPHSRVYTSYRDCMHPPCVSIIMVLYGSQGHRPHSCRPTNTALSLTVGSTHLTETVCTHHVSLSSWCYMVPRVIGHIAVDLPTLLSPSQ